MQIKTRSNSAYIHGKNSHKLGKYLRKSSATALFSQNRIIGLDLARALALMGMIVAHLFSAEGSANFIFHGFPSALFAILAGVSLGLMSDKAVKAGGQELTIMRHRLMVRGVLLFLLGVILEPLSGSILVVLQVFGLCYIALCCAPRWQTRTLVVVAIWLLAITVTAQVVAAVYTQPFEVLSFPYPAAAWAFYMVIGIIAYRFMLDNSRVLYSIIAIAIPVVSLGVWLRHAFDWETLVSSSDKNIAFVAAALNATSHSGALIDVLSTTVGALALLSMCLLLCQVPYVARVAYPLQCLGSMPLTFYVLHLLSAGLAEKLSLNMTTIGWSSLLGFLILATIMRRFCRQGLLERAIKEAILTATNTTLPARF
ncbi:hypothetical protein [Corynebacterium sp. sy039]|uniref:hypothetical protein n=1 Tax=Corynebacterium sp. sy039 TaxID=2599641 RepID=UPI0011B700C9|nr:hypothetical protein [Corynebacterium sp. sy039]QDZ42492.1 hypothetical protein FQV43_04430 [Corynebacterium sp. sy039]